MSKDRQVFDLYALALSLVHDEAAAGDLFMDARGERDLLRKAAVWRRRRGLWPAGLGGAGPGAPLPELSPDQRRHALHLHRRGARRRQIRLALWFSAACSFLAGAVLLQGALADDRPGLAAHPAFGSDPSWARVSDEGLRFAVYRAEADPGAVQVWWALEGPGAGAQSAHARPALRVGERTWVEPEASELEHHRADRVLGHSTFQAPGQGQVAFVRAGGEGSPAVTVLLQVMDDDPRARTLWIGHEVSEEIQVRSVTLGRNYTLLRYSVQWDRFGLRRGEAAPPPGLMPEVYAGEALASMGPWSESCALQTEAAMLFEPVPAGARSLLIRFPGLPWAGGVRTYPLPSPDITSFRQEGGVVTLDVRVPEGGRVIPSAGDAPRPSYLQDQRGRQYPVRVANHTQVAAGAVPGDARLVSFTALVLYPNPAREVSVDLTRPAPVPPGESAACGGGS